MPLWRCKILNGNTWTEVEVVGDEFLKELKRRFGSGVKFKDVEQFCVIRNEFVPVYYYEEADA